METTIKKWGRSLGIRLPAGLARQAKITEGSKVSLVLKKNRIEVIPCSSKEYTLKELLDGITEENLHTEIDTGYSVGNEI